MNPIESVLERFVTNSRTIEEVNKMYNEDPTFNTIVQMMVCGETQQLYDVVYRLCESNITHRMTIKQHIG